MKKLAPLMLTMLLCACDKSDLFIEPNEEISEAIQVFEEPVTSIDQVFMIVEKPPSYPGGMQAWQNHLGSTLRYPKEAKMNGIEGAVYLSFIVDKTGELRDMEVVKRVGHGCDEEALRVLMESENWNPGLEKGKAVNTKMQIRIVFRLSEGRVAHQRSVMS